MPLKGLSNDYTIPYVPENCKDDDVKTVFHIKPKDAEMSNRFLADASRSIKQGKGGQSTIIAAKYSKQELAQWMELVTKIENFIFADDHPEYPGKLVKDVSSDKLIKEVYFELPYEIIQEIFNATEDATLVTDALKNVSNSSRTISDGKMKK